MTPSSFPRSGVSADPRAVHVAELAADINNWVTTWNDNPKPFIWHKTADQILQRLAGYCTAITTNTLDNQTT